MDLIRLVLYHSRIANAHIHDFRIENSEERVLQTKCCFYIFFPRLAAMGLAMSALGGAPAPRLPTALPVQGIITRNHAQGEHFDWC